MQGSQQPSPEVIKVLGRALTDEVFRNDLFTSPDSAASSLGPQDLDELKKILNKMGRGSFDALVQVFRDYIIAHGFHRP